MAKKLNLAINLSIYSDSIQSTNPLLRDVYLVRDFADSGLYDTLHESIEIDPSETFEVFDGTRNLNLDALTQATLALVSGDKYKLTLAANGGTFSGFRTKRTITLDNTSVLDFDKITGQLLEINVIGGTIWSLATVQIGDQIKIENAANVNVNNKGLFTVKAKSGTILTVENPNGVSEVVTLNNGANITIFSAAGTQPGDNLTLASPFAETNRGEFTVLEVTADYVTFSANVIVPEGPITGIQSGGLVVYNRAYKFVYIEVESGEAAMLLNDSNDESHKVKPLNSEIPGIYMKTGPVFKIEIKNLRNDIPLSLRVVASQRE
jgi:hypothetical protein